MRGVVKSALLCSSSQGGDPPDLWQPPADEVSFLRVNPVRGGGGPGAGVGVGTGSDSKEDAWGGSNLGSSFPTPKDICNGLDKFVIGQERAKKVKMMLLLVSKVLLVVVDDRFWLVSKISL